MTLIALRRGLAAATVLTLSLTLAACGSDDAPADDPTSAAPSETPAPEPIDEADVTVLSEDDLSQALLTSDDLPGGFVDDPDDGEDDNTAFAGSCLEDVAVLTDQPEFQADEKVEASFKLEGDAGVSSVTSQVESYADPQQIVDAIRMFSEVVGACDVAVGSDGNGLDFDLEILSDQEVSLSGVDEQARVAVKGTISTNGLELPADLGFNVARIGNNLITVATVDIGEVGDGIVPQTDSLGQVSVDRLAEITG